MQVQSSCEALDVLLVFRIKQKGFEDGSDHDESEIDNFCLLVKDCVFQLC